jgi:hypothetical protein
MIIHPVINEIALRTKAIQEAISKGGVDLSTAIGNYAWVHPRRVKKDNWGLESELGEDYYPELGIGQLQAASPLEANDGEGSIPFIISTIDEDRDGDIVIPLGCQLHNYSNNALVFFGHQSHPYPIGVSRSPDGRITVFPEQNRIRATCYFDRADPDADFIYGKVKRGILSAASIAFVPIEAYRRESPEGRTHEHSHSHLGKAKPSTQANTPPGWLFKVYDLTEWSIVGVPSNAGAIRDTWDKEYKQMGPKLQKAWLPYCAKAAKSWNGWCSDSSGQLVKAICSDKGCTPIESIPNGLKEDPTPRKIEKKLASRAEDAGDYVLEGEYRGDISRTRIVRNQNTGKWRVVSPMGEDQVFDAEEEALAARLRTIEQIKSKKAIEDISVEDESWLRNEASSAQIEDIVRVEHRRGEGFYIVYRDGRLYSKYRAKGPYDTRPEAQAIADKINVEGTWSKKQLADNAENAGEFGEAAAIRHSRRRCGIVEEIDEEGQPLFWIYDPYTDLGADQVYYTREEAEAALIGVRQEQKSRKELADQFRVEGDTNFVDQWRATSNGIDAEPPYRAGRHVVNREGTILEEPFQGKPEANESASFYKRRFKSNGYPSTLHGHVPKLETKIGDIVNYESPDNGRIYSGRMTGRVENGNFLVQLDGKSVEVEPEWIKKSVKRVVTKRLRWEQWAPTMWYSRGTHRWQIFWIHTTHYPIEGYQARITYRPMVGGARLPDSVVEDFGHEDSPIFPGEEGWEEAANWCEQRTGKSLSRGVGKSKLRKSIADNMANAGNIIGAQAERRWYRGLRAEQWISEDGPCWDIVDTRGAPITEQCFASKEEAEDYLNNAIEPQSKSLKQVTKVDRRRMLLDNVPREILVNYLRNIGFGLNRAQVIVEANLLPLSMEQLLQITSIVRDDGYRVKSLPRQVTKADRREMILYNVDHGDLAQIMVMMGWPVRTALVEIEQDLQNLEPEDLITIADIAREWGYQVKSPRRVIRKAPANVEEWWDSMTPDDKERVGISPNMTELRYTQLSPTQRGAVDSIAMKFKLNPSHFRGTAAGLVQQGRVPRNRRDVRDIQELALRSQFYKANYPSSNKKPLIHFTIPNQFLESRDDLPKGEEEFPAPGRYVGRVVAERSNGKLKVTIIDSLDDKHETWNNATIHIDPSWVDKKRYKSLVRKARWESPEEFADKAAELVELHGQELRNLIWEDDVESWNILHDFLLDLAYELDFNYPEQFARQNLGNIQHDLDVGLSNVEAYNQLVDSFREWAGAQVRDYGKSYRKKGIGDPKRGDEYNQGYTTGLVDAQRSLDAYGALYPMDVDPELYYDADWARGYHDAWLDATASISESKIGYTPLSDEEMDWDAEELGEEWEGRDPFSKSWLVKKTKFKFEGIDVENGSRTRGEVEARSKDEASDKILAEHHSHPVKVVELDKNGKEKRSWLSKIPQWLERLRTNVNQGVERINQWGNEFIENYGESRSGKKKPKQEAEEPQPEKPKERAEDKQFIVTIGKEKKPTRRIRVLASGPDKARDKVDKWIQKVGLEGYKVKKVQEETSKDDDEEHELSVETRRHQREERDRGSASEEKPIKPRRDVREGSDWINPEAARPIREDMPKRSETPKKLKTGKRNPAPKLEPGTKIRLNRSGKILESFGEGENLRYRVEWSDGVESDIKASQLFLSEKILRIGSIIKGYYLNSQDIPDEYERQYILSKELIHG